MATKAIKATGTTLIGMPVSRVDGRLKVTGAAQYAAEVEAPGMTHAVLVGSAIASGRITRIDATATERAPGVLLVLTHENRSPLGQLPNTFDQGGTTPEARPPLTDANIHYAGQYVALVVAEQLEQAQYAASLLRIEYERAPFAVAIEDAPGTLYRPEQALGEDLQTSRGDPDAALAAAEVRLDQTYTTPMEHPCAMEPHACVATWQGDALTIHDSTQWVMGDAHVLQKALGLPPEKIQVLAPFVGGMFGSKTATSAHAILAALAAKRLGRPVKCVLTREHVLTTVGHRPLTIQRVQLGAARDGALQACRHATTVNHVDGRRVRRDHQRGDAPALYLPELRGVARVGEAARDETRLDARAGRSAGHVRAGVRDGRAGVCARHGPGRAEAAQPRGGEPADREAIFKQASARLL